MEKMGMSIDDAYKILSNGLVNAPSEHEWCVAFKVAIDTMRKYQKIEEIADSLKKLAFDEMSDIERRILEVIEGGNVNLIKAAKECEVPRDFVREWCYRNL